MALEVVVVTVAALFVCLFVFFVVFVVVVSSFGRIFDVLASRFTTGVAAYSPCRSLFEMSQATCRGDGEHTAREAVKHYKKITRD